MDTQELIAAKLSITPFKSKLVGADDEYLYFKEYNHAVKEDRICIIQVLKTDFEIMMKLWIESKTDYCKRHSHWCGQEGNFYITDYSFEREGKLYFGTKEDDGELVDDTRMVNIFKVLSFDKTCDMEHG